MAQSQIQPNPSISSSSTTSPPPLDTSVAVKPPASSAAGALNPRPASGPHMDPRHKQRLTRPTLGSRKSSGSLIVPRDSPTVEVKEEHYDEGDARAMSPRRSSNEINEIDSEARAALQEQAENQQKDLMEILDRVASVQSECQKMEGESKFLQSYIGELISSQVSSTGAGASKAKKGRGAK